MCRSFSIIFAAIEICKKGEKEKRGKKGTSNKATDEKRKTNAIFLFAYQRHFVFFRTGTLVCCTINEWSNSLMVCTTSCEVTQRGKFCQHTRMLCKHFFAWVRAKSNELRRARAWVRPRTTTRVELIRGYTGTTTHVDFEVDRARPPPADSQPWDLLITMAKETVILYEKEFRKMKKVVSLLDLKVMKTQNDCEIV